MSLPRRQYWFNASLQHRSRAGPSIKTTRQIAPPGIGRAEWLWQQLHYSAHTSQYSPVVTRAKWAAVTGSTQDWLIISHKLADTSHLLSKWIHSEVCLPMMIQVLRHVTNDSSGPETGALFTRGYWLHLPGLSIVTHVSSVTSHQLQAQYLTLIFITQPTNKFRLTNLNTKLILWPLALVPVALQHQSWGVVRVLMSIRRCSCVTEAPSS